MTPHFSTQNLMWIEHYDTTFIHAKPDVTKHFDTTFIHTKPDVTKHLSRKTCCG